MTLRATSALVPLLFVLTACPQTIRVQADSGVTREDSGVAGDASVASDSGVVGDAGDGLDATAEDAGALDASTGRDAESLDAEVTDAGGPACFVDPFDPCPDPDEATRLNNDWSSATYFNGNHTIGCLTGDQFTGLDLARTTVLCPGEPADWYQLTLVECDTRTMFGEIRMTPHTMCPSDAWTLNLIGEGSDPCTQPHVECFDDGADRVMRIRLDAPSHAVVYSWYIGVVSAVQDVKLDYTLSVRLQ